jgi:chemotaxis protein MotB
MKKTFLILLVGGIFSCVPSKKYNDLLQKKLTIDSDFAECQDSLQASQARNKSYSERIETLSSLNRRLKTDSTILSEKLGRTQTLLDEQNQTTERLRKDYKDLLANYSNESNKLSSNLAKKEQQLLELEKSLLNTKSENEKLLSDLTERERRLKELEKIIKSKDSSVVALRNSVTDALLAFKDNGLTVKIKNGKVYVSLSEKLLFGSGSTTVDKKGEDAIKKLAEVLKKQPDVNIMVEGHTDDVPVNKNSGAAFSDNWDLSVLRATEITRILVKEGVSGKRITASGRSQFVPVAEGKTPEVRQMNRRTEIILTPKLDELFKILESE